MRDCGTAAGAGSVTVMTDHRPEVRVKVYEIIRDEDVSGISGTGRVGDVAVFPNGKVVVAWDTPQRISTVVIYDSLEDAQKIHGHSGKTRFVPPAPPIEPVGMREALEELRNAATNVFPHGTVEAMQRWHKAFNNANAALAAKEAEARDWQVLLNKRDTLQAELARCREALEQIAKHTKDERTKAWATAALQPERGEQG